jgi:hypothetical protein
VATRDQQLAELHNNERLVLENLHPDHPGGGTPARLPGVRSRAVAERGSLAQKRCRSCATRMDRHGPRACMLVWHGRLSLVPAEEPGPWRSSGWRASALRPHERRRRAAQPWTLRAVTHAGNLTEAAEGVAQPVSTPSQPG